MQAAVFAVFAIVYITSTNNKADDANRKIDDLKIAVADLGAKISAIPDYAARLAQAERRIADGDVRIGTLDTRLTAREDGVDGRVTRDEIAAAAFEARLGRLEAATGAPVRQPH